MVKEAAQQNPQYRGSKLTYESRLSTYKATWNRFFPAVSLNTGYSDSQDSSGNSRWDAAATASLNLFNASDVAALRRASAEVDQFQLRFQLDSAQLRFSLKQAFVDLLAAQELALTSRKIVAIREENAQTVALKYESGRESKGNRLRIEAEWAQAQADLRKAERGLIGAQSELRRQLGQSSFSTLVATGVFEPGTLVDRPLSSASLSNHPSLRELQAALDLAQASLSSARSSLWPTLSASYSRSATGPTYFPENENWNLRGVLSLPLFSGGPTLTYYQTKAAQQLLEKAQQDLLTQELKLRTEIESTWNALADALDNVLVRQQFLAASRQRNEEATIRYSMGAMSFDDWERVVTDLVTAEQGLIQSRQNALVAEAQWNLIQAVPLEE